MTPPENLPLPPLRVGLFGFGKAGQAVCTELMKAEDVDLVWVVRQRAEGGPDAAEAVVGELQPGQRTPLLGLDRTDIGWLLDERPVDFLIDFSAIDTCLSYARAAAERGIGIVSAISNYGERQLGELREAAASAVVLHSPNITVGINFVMLAAKALQRLAPHADIEIIEEHFRGKREVSGTARRIAQALELDENRHVNSVRVGGIVGRHEIVFGFPNQTLRLVHDSISRNAFGQGVLFALRALTGRPPGFYTMEELVAEGFADAIRP
ncbi:MAG: 4-hydroxy-tetrahydrodipicolinate reductase [Pseudomonadota bacterium]